MKQITELDRAIGARLRLVRKRAGFSQTVLAGTIGVTFQQLQKYERGTNRIAASTLVRLADALAIPPGALLDMNANGAAPSSLMSEAALQMVVTFEKLSPRMQQVLTDLAAVMKRRRRAGA